MAKSQPSMRYLHYFHILHFTFTFLYILQSINANLDTHTGIWNPVLPSRLSVVLIIAIRFSFIDIEHCNEDNLALSHTLSNKLLILTCVHRQQRIIDGLLLDDAVYLLYLYSLHSGPCSYCFIAVVHGVYVYLNGLSFVVFNQCILFHISSSVFSNIEKLISLFILYSG